MSSAESGMHFDKLIVVGGSPRSGTTLVQRMLLTHPGVKGGPEFDLLAELGELFGRARARVESGRLAYYFDEAGVTSTFRSMCRELLAACELAGESHVCEKTPKNVLGFEHLIRLLPEAQFVFVYRDPRAIVASMLEVGRRGQRGAEWNDIDVAIDYVNRHWRGYLELQQKARVVVVKYETLVTRPEETSEWLLGQLNLEPFPIHCDVASYPVAMDIVGGDKFHSEQSLISAPKTESLDKWRRLLSGSQQRKVERWIQESELSRQDFKTRPAGTLRRYGRKAAQVSRKLMRKRSLHKR